MSRAVFQALLLDIIVVLILNYSTGYNGSFSCILESTMASAIAFLLKKRYESIVESQKERERRRKAKAQRIPPPPESTEDTAVWFWKLRDVPITVMLDKENKEVWCNGETPETQKILPKGTGEQMGLSFTIKVPNLDLLESEAASDEPSAIETPHGTDDTAPSPTPQCNRKQSEPACATCTPDHTQTFATDMDLTTVDTENPDIEVDRRTDRAERRASAPVGIQKPRRCSQIGKLMQDYDYSGSSDSLYYDANDDANFASGFSTNDLLSDDMDTQSEQKNPFQPFANIPEQVTENVSGFNDDSTTTIDSSTTSNYNQSQEFYHNVPEPYSNPTSDSDPKNTEHPTHSAANPSDDFPPDGSDDSGYEMAEEMPKFYYHDARIRCFVLGEHRIFELYVDGSMIQEHTKHIQCDNMKNDVAKKMD